MKVLRPKTEHDFQVLRATFINTCVRYPEEVEVQSSQVDELTVISRGHLIKLKRPPSKYVR